MTTRSEHQGETRNCSEHGAYESVRHRIGWTGCPVCAERQKAEEQHQREECWRRERVQDRIAASGLVGRYREVTFDSFNATTQAQHQAVDACRKYAAEARDGTWRPLWLVGSIGTGKTHLAASVVKTVIEERDRAAELVTARDIVRQVRATWVRSAEHTEADVLERYSRLWMLAIDELGVGSGSDNELALLLDVVDGRYSRGLPTIVMSNLDAKGLLAVVGDRTFDRLRENSETVPFNWPSHRARRAEQ